ncbi:MAG: histone deacetylase, partial [Candidatus Subteraquimicrobiales bacterium]|nr:histone deacetylase [Candidatus Subteraquimicrobiales bacterium]
MLKSALFYHPLFLEHLTGFGHPEKPERLIAILDCLKGKEIFSEVKLLEPEPAYFEELSKVHPAYYLNYLEERVEEGGYLDADTVVSLKSFRVACLAAGAVIRAIDKILDGEIKNAFCLVRPPGHHALSEQAMGFCLLNNLAVGARYALEERNSKKILIFDWDAHHGNGLQDIFYADSSVLYISLHQMPLYPGTGHFDEVGEGKGKGFTVNVPLPAGSGDNLYIYILKELI